MRIFCIMVFILSLSLNYLCVCSVASIVQTQKAGVVGIITDSQDSRIIGAEIKITNSKTKQEYKASSDDLGLYKIANVEAGQYQAEVRAKQFGVHITNLYIPPSTTLFASFSLSPEVISEIIEVNVKKEDSEEPINLADFKGTDVIVVKPKLKKAVRAQYTTAATALLLEGKVTVRATVDEKGDVIDVQLAKVSNNTLNTTGLTEEAVRAAYQWKFFPAMLNGRAVKARSIIRFNFKMPF